MLTEIVFVTGALPWGLRPVAPDQVRHEGTA
jgi:hypothetical protein